METTSLRPFGMRYLVVARGVELCEPEEEPVYDAVRQLNVVSTGDPWAMVADNQRRESTTEVTSDGTRTDYTDPY